MFLLSKVFKYALQITWQGLLALFLAMLIIYLITIFLNKVTKTKKR